MYAHHYETNAIIAGPTDQVFAFVDDHANLSAHMRKRSWMMLGSRMSTETDAGLGKRIGSKIRMSGSMLGLALSLEEAVVEYAPPCRKVWETIGTPKLLVVGPYRMGLQITPQGEQSLLQVFIDYAVPAGLLGRLLGWAFGGFYAGWCTQRIVDDVQHYFATVKAR